MRTEYCSKCGSILEPGAAFCGECGAPVTAPKDEKESAAQQTSFWQSPAASDADSSSSQGGFSENTAATSVESSSAQPVHDFEQTQNEFSQGNYQQPQNEFSQGNYQQPQSGFSQGNYQQPQNGFSQGNYQQPQNGFSQGNYQQSQNGFSQGNYQQPQNGFSQGNFQQSQGGFQQFHGNSPYSSQPGMPTSNQKNIVLILGIVAIVFALIFPLITYPAAIVGLVMASKAKKAGENVQGGLICCIIGLILAIINSLMGIILALAQMAYYL